MTTPSFPSPYILCKDYVMSGQTKTAKLYITQIDTRTGKQVTQGYGPDSIKNLCNSSVDNQPLCFDSPIQYASPENSSYYFDCQNSLPNPNTDNNVSPSPGIMNKNRKAHCILL